jgi:uncharacterized protein YbjT (DUF2867 family)
MRLLIVGGTGTVGSAVMTEALGRGLEVRVMTRSAEKAAALPVGVTGVVGDLEKPETLAECFAGADAAFVATALSQHETQMGLNAVAAALGAATGHVVYLSVHKVRTALHIPHFASKVPIEDALAQSGLRYTILQPNNFFQNDYWFQEAIVRYGVYPQPMSTKGINRVDVRDIALAAVNSIADGKHAGKGYPLVGPDALTGDETAEIYSSALGRAVRYIGADLEGWEKSTRTMMPGWLVDDLKIMYGHFVEHGLAAPVQDVEACSAVLGRAPRRFADWVAEIAPAWRAAG